MRHSSVPSSIRKGLTIRRVFSPDGQSPFDTVQWERRDAVIRNQRGDAIFEHRGVEFPTSWSRLATNVVVSKYFYGDVSHVVVEPSGGGPGNLSEAARSPGNPDHCGLGHRAGILRHQGGRRALLRRVDVALLAPVRGLQQSRLVQCGAVPSVRGSGHGRQEDIWVEPREAGG